MSIKQALKTAYEWGFAIVLQYDPSTKIFKAFLTDANLAEAVGGFPIIEGEKVAEVIDELNKAMKDWHR